MKNFMRLSFFSALVMSLCSTALTQTPAFDPRDWKSWLASKPTEVLTLGSPHLSQIATTVNDALMTDLLDKLAVFHPKFITIEDVSGEQCDHFKRYASVYPGSFEAWCFDPVAAQKAIGIDGPTAEGEVDKMLATWPVNPTAVQHRHLAALFLAADNAASARVQWLRLPTQEQHVGDGITAETLPFLKRKGAKPNETMEVAAALAARLGLERVYQVDDHTSDGAVPDEGQPYTDAIHSAWKAAPSKAIPVEKEMEAQLKSSGDVLALYRFMNQPQTLAQNIRADFGAALREPSSGQYGRQYVAAWEVRNLRMISNVVAVFASHPGMRVLNIVGASHKPYFDAYLNLMHDVKLVDAEDVLK